MLTNKCPVVPNRGIGKPGMCFIWERMMDRVAQALDLTPSRCAGGISSSQRDPTRLNGNIYGSGDYQLLKRLWRTSITTSCARTEGGARTRQASSASASSSVSSRAAGTPRATWRFFRR